MRSPHHSSSQLQGRCPNALAKSPNMAIQEYLDLPIQEKPDPRIEKKSKKNTSQKKMKISITSEVVVCRFQK